MGILKPMLMNKPSKRNRRPNLHGAAVLLALRGMEVN
jgi:hypothetical protein